MTSESTSPREGVCEGHVANAGGSEGGGGSGGGEIAANSPIQSVTPAQCQALPVFDGSNSSAVRTVTDARGGPTRSYEIAKLADGKRWMLTNLKLGSTSGSITLTPAASDVESNFTLPQLTTGGTAQYDIPGAYGPLTSVGDTGSGATNYGFLYNFAAATAGHTRTSLTIGSSQQSICPAGWHLPTAGDFSGLDIAFGGTGNYAENSQANIAKWQPAGPFKGSFSGYWFGAWYDDFGGQGGWGGWPVVGFR